MSTGCYRTVYRNFEPPGDTARARVAPRRSPGWRSFFLYGWLPRELVVPAATECGGAANVREIRTRRSFRQGLVAKFASSAGVNVYSPWTGEIVCGEDDPSRAAGRRTQRVRSQASCPLEVLATAPSTLHR